MTCTCTEYQLYQVGCDCGHEREEPVRAEAYAYDPATYAWTKRVVYEARNRIEAQNWIKFNINRMKYGHIVERCEPVSEAYAHAMRGDNS